MFNYDSLYSHLVKRKLADDPPTETEILQTLRLVSRVCGNRSLYVALGATYTCAYLSAGFDKAPLLSALKSIEKE